MIDAAGQLVYVGMSRRLRRRLGCYFSSRGRRKKEHRIGRGSRTLIWQPVAHELIARLRERELIRYFRPEWNVQGHPTQRTWGYITLVSQEAGSFSVSLQVPRKHDGLWGPLAVTRHLRSAVAELNYHFRLRDCPRETPMHFQHDRHSAGGAVAPACLRADLGTCLSPCISGCTRRTYAQALAAAKTFLDGRSRRTLVEVETAMHQAAAARQFEKAAALRDRLDAFQRLDRSLRWHHDWSSQANFVYPFRSEADGQEWWLMVIRGVAVQVVPRPTSHAARAEILPFLGECGRDSQTVPGLSAVTGPDEFESARILRRWFRLLPAEKDRCWSLAKARRLCQSTSGRQE